MGALPLRNMSRLWGYLNSFQLPAWFRPIGFKLYAFVFSANLDEIDPEDLKQYKSLGDFFYRKLKPGARPIADSLLVSPADGTVLHLGEITGNTIEQVKGITYNVNALFGVPKEGDEHKAETIHFAHREHAVVDDQEFANVNGIEYTLDQLMGSGDSGAHKMDETVDASVPQSDGSVARDASVAMSIGIRPTLQRSMSLADVKDGSRLFFAVIYLAPGDYHRFHSPAAWVVQKRRHFSGELFSVSPYVAKRLENLFVLNERVALLGRWRHGFFGMVPVGATNVGSININFDQVSQNPVSFLLLTTWLQGAENECART
jgi:phosphatidylserine decarboxylase